MIKKINLPEGFAAFQETWSPENGTAQSELDNNWSREFVIVSHGVEHRPVAEKPCEVVLLEPNTTLNTGTV